MTQRYCANNTEIVIVLENMSIEPLPCPDGSAEILGESIDSPSMLVDIKDKLWNGCINVRVTLEMESKLLQFLFTAYRNSYVPVFLPDIVAYFQHYLPDLCHFPVWLEYENVPVKWHLPIGIMYDCLHLPSSSPDDRNEWKLSLRYGEYPEEHLIPFKNTSDYIGSLKEVVVNQLKQSCFALNGNSKNIMNLSESKSNELCQSIVNHNLKSYAAINKRIVPPLSKIHKIPVKIIIPGFASTVQAPVYPNSNGKVTTLSDVLHQQLPEIFKNDLGVPYIHGIPVENLVHTPIVKVWDLFKHLDNFLYITVILQH